MKHSFFVVSLVFFSAVSCTTANQESQMDSLKTANNHTPPMDEISRDLMRNDYVRTPRDPHATTAHNIEDTLQTDTSVEMIPYTEPLIRAQLNNELEKAFSRRPEVSEKVRQQTFEKLLRQELKDKTLSRQCFILKISASCNEAYQEQFWSGFLEQNKNAQSLSFQRTGAEHSWVNFSTNSGVGFKATNQAKTQMQTQHIFACTRKPIQVTETFKVVLEPRYQKNLLPLELVWKKPESP